MSWELLVALALFSFAASITPGPNNLMLLASGVNFGFLRSVPHMLGIVTGFAVLLGCVGSGLGQLLSSAPKMYWLLKIAGGGYLLYLAWRIAASGPLPRGESSGRPLTFLQAAAFQWVNPKAWVMAVTSMALYTVAEKYQWSVAVVVVVFTLINLPCISVWCGLGSGLRLWLSDPRRLRIFNIVMALLLVASL